MSLERHGRLRGLLLSSIIGAVGLALLGGVSLADPVIAAGPEVGGGHTTATPPQPGSWPQPAFDARNRGYNPAETTLTTANVGGLIVRWSASGTAYLPGSPPVVSADGTVFVGATGALRAFRAVDGAELWTAQVPDYAPEPDLANGLVVVAGSTTIEAFDAAGVTNCSGSPTVCQPIWSTNAGVGVGTPVYSKGSLFAGSTDAKVIAFNAKTGKIRWTFDTSNGSYSGVYSAPAVSGGVVFVTCANHDVYALDASTGALLWSHDMGAFIYGPPAVGRGVVYVESFDGVLHALAPATGDELWTADTRGAVFGGFAVGPKAVYVNGPLLEAFDASGNRRCSGTPKICKALWKVNPGDGGTSPALANGVLYASISNPLASTSALYAYDATTGTELWSHQILFNSGWASPSVASGVVYVVSETYPTYEVDAFALPVASQRTTGSG